MYICLDCRCLFEQQEHYVETHGLDTPPYEEWDGCPYCSGPFTEAYICEHCDNWITDDYVIIDGKRYCQNCYSVLELGDE